MNEVMNQLGMVPEKKKKKIIPPVVENKKQNTPNMENKEVEVKEEEEVVIPKKTKKIIPPPQNETEVLNVKMNLPPTDEERLVEQVKKNVGNSMIEPLFWVLPNKKSFPQWVTETFLKYRADGKPLATKPGEKKAFKYQQLLRDYMQNKSPYRGVLLYHTLGAGKTMSSIIIAENLKTEKNIVVMLPASLKPNFEKEIQSLPAYQRNRDAWRDKYSFVSYNASNTLDQIRRIGTLDNKVIIIDEVHNLVSKMVSGIMGISKQGFEIYQQLMDAQNCKIIALSGTPVINDAFEVAVLMNVLRGHIEMTHFRILQVDPKYGERWDFTQLESLLAQIPYVDYLEVNKVNGSIAFHITVRSYTDEYRETVEKIEKTCKENGVDVRKLQDIENFTLFPIENEGEEFRRYFIQEDPKKGDRIKPSMSRVFKSRILGLISFYKPLTSNYPDVVYRDFYRVNMSPYQYQIYNILRNKERISERGSAKARGSKKRDQVKSTFRVFSRQSSNFVFPEEIPRPYPDPKFIVTVKKKNENSNAMNNAFLKSAQLEMMLNEDGKVASDYKKRIEKALGKLIEKGETYLRPGPEGLDKLSPKMEMMLMNIQESPGLVFVYSNFRSLEGVEIFTKILDFNGFASYQDKTKGADVPRYTLYSGTEDQEQKTEILRMFTSDENKTGNLCKILLATSAGAEGLDLKNIRQIHIMEPYWNQMRIQQVIGRGVRRNSHIALPEADRNIHIFRYFSVLGPDEIKLDREKVATDEYIEEISQKKQIVLDELKMIMMESAFDCVLNAPDIQGDYRCFDFGQDAEGLAYFPQLGKDVVYSSRSANTKQESRQLTLAIYHDKKIYLIDKKKKKMYLARGDAEKKLVDLPEKVNKVYLNPDTFEIYDAKSVQSKNPVRVGFVTSTGSYSKTRKD